MALSVDLPWLGEIVSAQQLRRLPVVHTRREVRLRVKGLNLERMEITVREGKGGKDRVTMGPENLVLPLRHQLGRAQRLHDQDSSRGTGR